jgi:outer membrane receptor protein involved in Fe transport
MFVYDEWTVSPSFSFGAGANYGHYDYLAGPSLFSPQLTATITPRRGYRVRASALRQLSAPGAQEFLPPTRATWVPPQRTFSPLTSSGFRTEELQHYEVAIEHDVNGATLGVRTFHQRIDDQMITLFGLRSPGSPAAALGHYHVGTVGDAEVTGWGLTVTHALAENVRGSIDYSLAGARWTDGAPSADAAVLARWVPAAMRPSHERFYDLTTSLETEIDSTATRVFVLYKINSAFLTAEGADEVRGIDGRFDVQVNQSLPFMNFRSSQWEMLVAVRNIFKDSLVGTSVFDELLVVRPPKRIVGGLTVRF